MSEAKTVEQIEAFLADMPEWEIQSEKLVCKRAFASFRDAVAAVARIAFEAEELNHHPDIDIRYNKVALSLCTHDADGAITEKDFELARKVNQCLP